MKKLETLQSFENFKVSKQTANKITGSRTKYFAGFGNGDCGKIIDDRYARTKKIKIKDRFDENC